MDKRDNLILLALSIGGVIMFNFIPWRIPENGRRFAGVFRTYEKTYKLPNNLLARMA